MSSLTARIRAEARRLGFFKMGVALSGPTPWEQHFSDWLNQGMQGEMAYLERQSGKRRDPALVLEHARSILILGMNYGPDPTPSPHPLQGRISRYARGADYHRLVAGRLELLLAFILRERPQVRGRCYTDTGPVMEKVWGAHSAFGWMGKHGNLITRELGSWFFVGVILLDIDLDCDVREKDFCGTCRRCLDACPTGAIVAPQVVDARLCISYLTIELRGAIPRALRPLLGNRIFGCDDCQEACPWNRFAVTGAEPAFMPAGDVLAPELGRLATMSTAEFEARFEHSPVRRARRDGLVRNAVVALGNSRRPEAIPALMRAVSDPSPLVRSHAAWALGRIEAVEARAALAAAHGRETDASVLEEIEWALHNSLPGSKSSNGLIS
jgi:epoxyqueuosine reductase